jgi:hypothetical protein
MLKSNSKKARENLQKYIIDGFTPENYTNWKEEDEEFPTEFPAISAFILTIFRCEIPKKGAYAPMTEHERFLHWCAGLPSLLDTCYYYNRSPVDDLGVILEETEEEKKKYKDDMKTQDYLSTLIYNELLRGEKKYEGHEFVRRKN